MSSNNERNEDSRRSNVTKKKSANGMNADDNDGASGS